MALAAKLQLRQSQSLVMTPQLLQSIRMLQLTHAELERFIDGEIEKNPLLERAAADEDRRGNETREVYEASPDGADDWLKRDLPSAEAIAERLDASLENVFPDDPGARERIGPDLSMQWKSSGGAGGEAAAEGFDLDDLAGPPPTLDAYVAEQIGFAFADRTERLVAGGLAALLDETGYMREDPASLAARLGVDAEVVLSVLSVCRTFDPPGLFARDLSDCLALQLERRDRLDPAMQAMLSRLDLLARRDFQSLKKLCGVDEEDLMDMLAEIRTLDPKPALAFASALADPITPDVLVRPAADGSWAVELNPETLPRVLVDQSYFARVSRDAKDQQEREFLNECLQSANWLARSLDQRAKTILKVTSEIVRRQDAFLLHGVRHLRPLNLRAVADAIGMHESTVSRVTANKYMLCPRGTFELRYFFTAAISSAEGGDSHSSEAVRDRIREMIASERPAEVLSDDAIVAMLKRDGVDIARRTVAKYRDALNIPSSVQRRREKKALTAAAR
jgi:RNA polymerase sigma-54 factor